MCASLTANMPEVTTDNMFSDSVWEIKTLSQQLVEMFICKAPTNDMFLQEKMLIH